MDEMTVKIILAAKAKPGNEKDVVDKLQKREPVKEIYLIESGTYDIIASIEVDSLDSYRDFVDEVAHLTWLVDFESFIRIDSE